MEYLYQELASNLKQQIVNGAYKAGDRLEGVRTASIIKKVSIATVISAYEKLEREGFVESRPRSGYYVRPYRVIKPITKTCSTTATSPQLASKQEYIVTMMESMASGDKARLGAVTPMYDLQTSRSIEKALRKALVEHRQDAHNYAPPSGHLELRKQLARQMSSQGTIVSPDEIVITSGCQEALTLALKSVTSPGDIVAVESPTYYGLLQVIEALGLQVIEVPCDPSTGIKTGILKQVLEQHAVKACILIPTFNNPSGYTMPESKRIEVISLLTEQGVTLVEDDIYADLSFTQSKPKSCYTLAPEADIIYCSSFSKSVEPGLRLGWACSKQHRDLIEYEKLLLNMATSSLPQIAMVEFLQSKHHLDLLKRKNAVYASNMAAMSNMIMKLFPEGTRISEPQGGFVLWLELDKRIDTFKLAIEASDKGISTAPGKLFSTTNNYNHCLRLSTSCWDDTNVQEALKAVAELAHQMLD